MVDLKNLFQDLNKIKDSRLEILTLQIYMEHFINKIITLNAGKIPKDVIKENLTIPVKTKILQDWNLINDDHKKVIDALAKTRNDLIHNIEVNTKKIDNRLKSVNFDFVRDKDKKRMKIFSRLKPYRRLTSASIVIIGVLYHLAIKMERKESFQNLKFEIEKINDSWEPRISLIENKK